MVDDVVGAADLARLVMGGRAADLVGVVERARSGVRAQDAGAADPGHQALAIGQERGDLGVGHDGVVRVLAGDVGGAQDADGMDRHDDVAVAGRRKAVDDGRGEPAVEDEHRALARAHGEGRAGQRSHLAGPGTGRRHDRTTRNRLLLAGPGVARRDGGDRPRRVELEADDGAVSVRVCPMLPRAGQGGIDQLPRLERRIGHPVGRANLPIQERLVAKQLVERDRFRLDPGRGAGRRKPVEVVVRVVGRGHEIATGRLDGAGGDTAQHGVLLDAVARGDRVALDIPRTGMQESVVAAARSRRKVAALHERRAQAAHGQVAQHPGTGRTAADDDDIDLGTGRHYASPRRSGSDPRR